MHTRGQPDEPSGALPIIYVGFSYDRTGTTASVLPVASGDLLAFNAELDRQQSTLRGPLLGNRRADAAALRLARFRLVTAMAPASTLTLRMSRTHPERFVNSALTWLTSEFVSGGQSALVLMNPGQGLTWYHLVPGALSVVQPPEDSGTLRDLPCPQADARRPWGVARLLATMSHRYLALPAQAVRPPDLPAPPPGSKNPIHLTA